MGMTTEELKAKYGDEQVLVWKAGLFKDMKKWTPHAEFDPPKASLIMPRYLMETDEAYRQAVAYVIIKDVQGRYFITERTGGDERLLGKLACVGGHMDGADESLSVTALREVDEECRLDALLDRYPIITKKGWIVCNDTPVDRVHVGCVFELQVEGGDISIRETDKLRGVWMTREHLLKNIDRCETWLAILLEENVMDGVRGPEQLAYHMLMTYVRKNADYGNAFYTTYHRFGHNAPLLRMYDKILRLKNLMDKQAQVADESTLDTLEDLANYAVMTAALQTMNMKDATVKKVPPIDRHSAITEAMLYSLAINGIGSTAPFHAVQEIEDTFDDIARMKPSNRQGLYRKLVQFAQRVMATIIMEERKDTDA